MAWYLFDEKVAVQEKRTLTLKSSDNDEFMISEGTSSSAASDEEFVSGDESKDLSKATSFLKVKGLLDIVSQKVADMMIDMSVESIREAFGVENDYTPVEEEEELRQKYGWEWEAHVDPKDD